VILDLVEVPLQPPQKSATSITTTHGRQIVMYLIPKKQISKSILHKAQEVQSSYHKQSVPMVDQGLLVLGEALQEDKEIPTMLCEIFRTC
jgi:hypothetical protein